MGVFAPTITLEQAAIYYPVLCFALSLPLFFLLTRRLLGRDVALLATTVLAVVPTILFRTLAGFADKDALSLLFILAVFYLYVRSWQMTTFRRRFCLALSTAGALTLLALTWEGSALIMLVLVGCEVVKLLADEYDKRELAIYLSLVVPAMVLTQLLTGRYRAESMSLRSPYVLMLFGAPSAFALIAALYVFLVPRTSIRVTLTRDGRLPLGGVLLGAFLLGGVTVALLFFRAQIGTMFLTPFGEARIFEQISELHKPTFANWWGWFGAFLFLAIGGALLHFRRLVSSLRWEPWWSQTGFLILVGGILYNQFMPQNDRLVTEGIYWGAMLLFAACLGIAMFEKQRQREGECGVENAECGMRSTISDGRLERVRRSPREAGQNGLVSGGVVRAHVCLFPAWDALPAAVHTACGDSGMRWSAQAGATLREVG